MPDARETADGDADTVASADGPRAVDGHDPGDPHDARGPDARAARRRGLLARAIDAFVFGFAGVASVWLAILVLADVGRHGWWALPLLLVFWGLLAYLVLPRLHRIMSDLYVPDYFFGRTRTSDGLLGDPVNVALLGEADHLHAALVRSGWTRADEVTVRSSWRIVTSTVLRRSYPRAPVSPLFLFGRQQDFAYQQEVAGTPGKRHHVRFWRCPRAGCSRAARGWTGWRPGRSTGPWGSRSSPSR
ncbi:hypothetical protein GCM10025875_25110 [Litorihabitans aurantiacus]|uniref:LssY-like C-terminal domain-containing protein n=1 Tax=Litorihabitans aurantiacus TaxID=1930061 RepID=A0AA37XFZ1_9MICO|nr:hypothetical protein GCM10025875_25110 [Litorihabitans aurantiacus]